MTPIRRILLRRKNRLQVKLDSLKQILAQHNPVLERAEIDRTGIRGRRTT